MGSGIAQVAAQGGWDVRLVDVSEAALSRARATMEKSTAKLVDKSVLTEQSRADLLDRVVATTDRDIVAEAELVVEAVFERLDVKQQVFADLDRRCPEGVVLATNTSAIPITKIAAATGRPETVVGTHFFSPVPVMALCELVRGLHTADDTVRRAREFAEDAGKTCVVVNRDVAGFVTTRLISALVMEAVRLYEAGVASAEDIDTACKLGFGHTMGPLATVDLTGIDVLHDAASNIYDDTAQSTFFPPELLSRMVAAGDLGRKTGRGFYSYG